MKTETEWNEMKLLRHHLKLLIIENLWEIKYAILQRQSPPIKGLVRRSMLLRDYWIFYRI